MRACAVVLAPRPHPVPRRPPRTRRGAPPSPRAGTPTCSTASRGTACRAKAQIRTGTPGYRNVMMPPTAGAAPRRGAPATARARAPRRRQRRPPARRQSRGAPALPRAARRPRVKRACVWPWTGCPSEVRSGEAGRVHGCGEVLAHGHKCRVARASSVEHAAAPLPFCSSPSLSCTSTPSAAPALLRTRCPGESRQDQATTPTVAGNFHPTPSKKADATRAQPRHSTDARSHDKRGDARPVRRTSPSGGGAGMRRLCKIDLNPLRVR